MRSCTRTAWIVATLLCLVMAAPAQALNHPFGSKPFSYLGASILPNHVNPAALDQAVADFYDEWKSRYVSEECGTGRYVIITGTQPGNLTVSEGHGYGMIITALMAGHDANAKAIFDGMYAYFREHPTATHASLMAWNQNKSCNDVDGVDSASDGDLDIAFALLLADKQWGSCGPINDLSEALSVLADITDGDLDSSGRYVTLGDWVTPADSQFYAATRTSDFVLDHYRAFAAASGDTVWNGLINETYSIVDSLQLSHSPVTGLLPDFVLDPLATPVPAGAGFLEGPDDGSYAYNAARDPWRIASDYLVSGDARAKIALDRINLWIRAASADDPTAIRAGYQLDGTALPGSNFLSMAFVAPFGVAAMVDAANQSWLNAMWDVVAAASINDEGYFENTLKMLAMLVMSGNWWPPDQVAGGCSVTLTPICTNPASITDARLVLKRLGAPDGDESLRLKARVFFPQGAPASLVDGAQILLEDVAGAGAAMFELSSVTTPVPALSAGVCDARRDGWKQKGSKIQYRNKSGALDPPTCSAASANGLSKIKYRVRSPLDFDVLLRSKRSMIGDSSGPVRVTLVFGASAAASAAGECATTSELVCQQKGSSLRCQ